MGYRIEIDISGLVGYWTYKPLRNEVGSNINMAKVSRRRIVCLVEMDGKAIGEIKVDFHIKIVLLLRFLAFRSFLSKVGHCLMLADSSLDISSRKNACLRISAKMADLVDMSSRCTMNPSIRLPSNS